MPRKTNPSSDSKKDLTKKRQKTIEMINKLIEQGYEKDEAIAIAALQPRRWIRERKL